MEYLPLISIIYGLFLLALNLSFTVYSHFEFSTLVYGIFFVSFGVGLFLLRIGGDLGLPYNEESNLLWFFSVTFFGTAVHIFFKNARIERVPVQEDVS